jgi:hypothetical protein
LSAKLFITSSIIHQTSSILRIGHSASPLGSAGIGHLAPPELVIWLRRHWSFGFAVMVNGNYKITRLQNYPSASGSCRTSPGQARLENLKIARLQDCKIKRLKDCKITNESVPKMYQKNLANLAPA